MFKHIIFLKTDMLLLQLEKLKIYNMINRCFLKYWILCLIISSIILFCSCEDEEIYVPPTISIIFEENSTEDGDIVAIGHPLRFKIEASGKDANITNFTIKMHFNGNVQTVMDSGLNSPGFVVNKTFYQGIEDEVEWVFTVMDRNRNKAETSLTVLKDPDSQFGAILHYPLVVMGYQKNEQYGHFFIPSTGEVLCEDTATLLQEFVDVIVYFNYSINFGVMEPSPTFSSPGEDPNASAEVYQDFYPFLVNWHTRNYTKWDIRADNGVTNEAFQNAQNDSLLIVSYNNVWGKKKYKWAYPGLFIPFETAKGKKGIIKVLEADFDEEGIIKFEMKIQI